MGRFRFIDFVDFGVVATQVRALAMAPFVESAWQPLLEKSRWSWSKEKSFFDHREGRDLLLPQSAPQLIEEPDGAFGDPRATVTFSHAEFKLLAAYSWCENLDEARVRSKFTDAFAKLQFEASAAIGQPDFRLHFVETGFPKLIFNVCVWCFADSDLYLMQDFGDMHGGETAIIDFRILPKRHQPTKFPLPTVLHA